MQEVRVERVAKEVHEGLHFIYRFSGPDSQDWQFDLGRLSGGERTLVSLALILAVSLRQPSEFAMHMHDCTLLVIYLSGRVQPCKQDTVAKAY